MNKAHIGDKFLANIEAARGLIGGLKVKTVWDFECFDKYGNLSKADQQYYKNDMFEGKNQLERTDSLVKEVNKVYGEMATMKAEIAALKAEVEALKNRKWESPYFLLQYLCFVYNR